MSNTKRRGRRAHVAKPGERMALGLRVTPDTKNKLDLSAQKTGRTQSQEAEARLERTFFQDDIGLLVGASFMHAAKIEAAQRGYDHDWPGSWIQDPACYDAGMVQALIQLAINRPGGFSGENLFYVTERLRSALIGREVNRESFKDWEAILKAEGKR